MIISYNYGHSSEHFGSSIMGMSVIFTAKTFRQFSDYVRDPLFFHEVIKYAKFRYCIPSTMALYVNIDNDHYICIHLKNVRGYLDAVKNYKDEI